MGKTIKQRTVHKDIKLLDKSATLSAHMKNIFVRTKTSAEQTHDPHHATPTDYATGSIQDNTQGAVQGTVRQFRNPRRKIHKNIERAKESFKEIKQQMPSERKRAAEQAQKTAQKAKSEAENLKGTTGQAKDIAHDAKKSVADAKQKLQETRQTGRQTIQNAKRGGDVSRPGYLNRGVIGQKGAGGAAQSLDKSAKTIKSTKKGFKKTAKGTVKTARKSVKTAERTARQTVKTAQRTAKTAQKTAQAAAKAAKAAERAARAAAKAAVQATKVAVKAVTAMIKMAIAAVKGLVAIIAAGGWVAVLVILLICMIGLLIGSIFGIFFSGEADSGTGQTINSVVAGIKAEYTTVVDGITGAYIYDWLDMSGAQLAWDQVLAVYAVRTVTDPNNPMEVATMTDEKALILWATFWEMNTISQTLDTVGVTVDVLDDDGAPTGDTNEVIMTVLRISVVRKSASDMAALYGFTDEQKDWLAELLKPEYSSLWNALLYGVASVGDGSMIEVAETQIGNIGGEHYWSWYGFNSRVAWCACFVSWCADQCGYIDAGVIPRFASCQDGIVWFKANGQWRDSGYTPATGDLIFYDWDADGVSDHVGIVEYVEGEYVHTIEGNTSDSSGRTSDTCSRRIRKINSSVMGYAVPLYP